MLNVVAMHTTPAPFTGPYPSVVTILAATYNVIQGGTDDAPNYPEPHLLATAASIIGVENAGGKAIQNGNFGNLTASDGDVWQNPYTSAPAASNVPAYFAAFDSLEAGATAWWKQMFRAYRSVLSCGLTGDTACAARELYRLGYVVATSANEQQSYAKGMANWYRLAWPDAQVYGAKPTPVQQGFGAAIVAAVVVSSSALLLLKRAA
jgi:hypothetical protein